MQIFKDIINATSKFFFLDQKNLSATWLEHRDCDRHGSGSKPTRTILLCPCERHFTSLYPAWRCWQAVLNFSHISIKLKKN